MLSELLQGIETGGLLIIQDSCSYSGRDLLRSFIAAALNREEEVHVLCFDVSEDELTDGLKPPYTQRLHVHNAYPDPLGWTDHPAFAVQQFRVEDLTDLVKQASQPKPATLVIDSLSWVLRHAAPPAVCRTLQQLRKGGAVRAVVALLHADMHQRGTVGSVCHLASSLIAVAPGPKGNEAVAKITKRSKSGKVAQDEETFCITEDLTVAVLSRLPEARPNGSEEEQADPTANLTFNLRLSESELEAKQKLTLPFVFSKEKKTALLHPGPGSGRILYEPDANDDYDQEDPDDDLDV
ncbi:elongator complex protein 5 [Fundulus heteroclitus]|uniref:elongator complex protein 5 n=1 Tax=Fundulus heteroclitus TaxID=8078 RepID=UPI00165C6B6C|nr:elongator complex protein 5 [Fundulus heteroclitus]